MKETPILFSAPMVKALLDGSKTQTRRILKQPKRKDGAQLIPEILVSEGVGGACPYGVPGEQLWVRETWNYITKAQNEEYTHMRPDGCPVQMIYRADTAPDELWPNWHPSIFMRRWMSRITLELTAVRVERVQDISRADAIAEGVCTDEWLEWRENALSVGLPEGSRIPDEIDEYAGLWNKLNFKRGYGWEVNPWVWVLEFRRVMP